MIERVNLMPIRFKYKKVNIYNCYCFKNSTRLTHYGTNLSFNHDSLY